MSKEQRGFAPKPWSVDPYAWNIVSDHGEWVAHCQTAEQARFIAAAPDLYEACNLALAHLANPQAFNEAQLGMKLARAIAKAEGKGKSVDQR